MLKNPRQSPEDIVSRTESMEREKETLTRINEGKRQDLAAQNKKKEQAHLQLEEQEVANVELQNQIDDLKKQISSQVISMSEFKQLKEDTAALNEKLAEIKSEMEVKEQTAGKFEQFIGDCKTTLKEKITAFNEKSKTEGLIDEQSEESSHVLLEIDADTVTTEVWGTQESKVKDTIERFIQQLKNEKITIEQEINSESDVKFAQQEELDDLT